MVFEHGYFRKISNRPNQILSQNHNLWIINLQSYPYHSGPILLKKLILTWVILFWVKCFKTNQLSVMWIRLYFLERGNDFADVRLVIDDRFDNPFFGRIWKSRFSINTICDHFYSLRKLNLLEVAKIRKSTSWKNKSVFNFNLVKS